MKNNTLKMTIGGLLLTAAVALAQETPVAAPLAAPVAVPVQAPRAKVVPVEAMPSPVVLAPQDVQWPVIVSPKAMDWQDAQEKAAEAMAKAQEKMTEAQQKAFEKGVLDWDAQQKAIEMAQEKMASIDWDAQQKAIDKAMEKVQDKWGDIQLNLDTKVLTNTDIQTQIAKLGDLKSNLGLLSQQVRTIPTPRIYYGGKGSDDGLYSAGLSDIDAHRYDSALANFNQVVNRNGSRTEGALYWKAYVLNKLGRSADAQAAIDQLRKTYPGSSWLDDAKALELEVKQSKGPVSPESETDEDIKILALNGLMQSDPEHALPQVESLLKTSHSPKLKRQAVTVIAMNGSPRAKQDLEGIARGSNPDLQLQAIRYLSSRRNDNSNAALFAEIYSKSSDRSVKSAILTSFKNNKDKDHLLAIVKSEKDPDLRAQAIRALGDVDGQPELWAIYPSETTAEGKIALLNAMADNGNIDKLAEVARTDSDPKVRQEAIQVLASQKAGNPGAAIAAVYANEKDPAVKRSIINRLAGMRNAKALIDIARVEKDTALKLQIVERLSAMTKQSKEASDYLQEILSK